MVERWRGPLHSAASGLAAGMGDLHAGDGRSATRRDAGSGTGRAGARRRACGPAGARAGWRMKAIVKALLLRCGAARLLHRLRNRAVLTVAMFHRVLPPEDPRFAGANPTYTVSTAEFAACLDLFTRFYTVVAPEAVEAAAEGAPLPPCPLLITFDDGWRDNAEFALPLLRARGLPALLFVATGHVGREEGFWQEELFDRIAARDAGPGGRRAADAAVAALIDRPAQERAARLAALPPRALPRRMADAAELRVLAAGGVRVGGHGHAHEPLTAVADAAAELRDCRATLAALGLGGGRPAFSFPHGRWTPQLAALARSAGFGLCFTSEAELTPVAALRADRAIGRVSIELSALRRRDGFDLPALAFSLITRRHGGAP
jgi:peptidoglycan/xylan/chitin deacetylase (PgdA/CDA1 family)